MYTQKHLYTNMFFLTINNQTKKITKLFETIQKVIFLGIHHLK